MWWGKDSENTKQGACSLVPSLSDQQINQFQAYSKASILGTKPSSQDSRALAQHMEVQWCIFHHAVAIGVLARRRPCPAICASSLLPCVEPRLVLLMTWCSPLLSCALASCQCVCLVSTLRDLTLVKDSGIVQYFLTSL